MQETLRQYYLNQLGIVSYFPKRQLPGAALAPAREFEEMFAPEPAALADQIDIVPDADNVGKVDQVRHEKLHNALEELAELVVNKKVPPAGPVSADSESVSKTAISPSFVASYHHMIWRLSNHIVVIDSAQTQLALPTNKLLANIAAALGFSDNQLSRSDHLRWPLDRAAAQSASPAELEVQGRDMMQAFLEAQFSRQSFTHLVLMGESAIRFCLSAQATQDQDLTQLYGQCIQYSKLSNNDVAVQAVLIPSLVEMLQQPQTKRIAWQALKVLRRQQ